MGGMGSGTPMPVSSRQPNKHGHASTPAHATQQASTGMANSASQFCTRPRREFLWEMGGCFVGVALAGLLQRDGFAFGAPAASANPLALKHPHFPAKAK